MNQKMRSLPLGPFDPAGSDSLKRIAPPAEILAESW
jgi:hypothetical protein